MTEYLIPFALGFLAGFVYIITPGPIFLCLTRTVAERNAKEGLKLVAGSLSGDIFWILLSLFSLIYSSKVDPRIFQIIGIACGAYLIYLGIKSLRWKSKLSNSQGNAAENPFRQGLILGFLNPKSYPVLLATVAGFLSSYISTPPVVLIVAMVIGTVIAYSILIAVCSHPLVKKLYLQNVWIIVKAVGLLFCFFGLSLLLDNGHKLFP